MLEFREFSEAKTATFSLVSAHVTAYISVTNFLAVTVYLCFFDTENYQLKNGLFFCIINL